MLPATRIGRMLSWPALALLLVLAVSAVAQEGGAGTEWAPRTGDAWLDAALADINAYAARYTDAFADELVRYQSAPRALVEEELAAGTKPGDLYFACAMAQALGRACRELVQAWREDGSGGWAGVAKRVDPAQATAALRQVRRGVAGSYLRWARPLPPDAAPGRGRRP